MHTSNGKVVFCNIFLFLFIIDLFKAVVFTHANMLTIQLVYNFFGISYVQRCGTGTSLFSWFLSVPNLRDIFCIIKFVVIKNKKE